MADTKTAPKTTSEKALAAGRTEYPPPKGPDLIVYAVRERDGARAIWTRIGAAFKHDSSDGMSIMLDALPVGRKLVLIPPKDDEDTA